VQQDELGALLTSFAAERLALLQRHEAGARVVSNYDFNNAYQYVIAREETHLSWLQSALEERGVSSLPPAAAQFAVPSVGKPGRNAEPSAYRSILEDDARQLAVFVERWRRPVASTSHARHRGMLNVILGESVEHQRLFQQAAAGLEDVIGRRTAGATRVGAVLPDRWME
jgi:hypothetical protein